MFSDDKRSAGMGPNAHESDDFMPTKDSYLNDGKELANESLIPGGYSDDHWRSEHKRVAELKAAREEKERIRKEEEAREKAAEEQRKKEEAERLYKESLPVSIWNENGGPFGLGESTNRHIQKKFEENEFVLNYLQLKKTPARFVRGLFKEGICPTQKLESKQRGLTFALLDIDADG